MRGCGSRPASAPVNRCSRVRSPLVSTAGSVPHKALATEEEQTSASLIPTMSLPSMQNLRQLAAIINSSLDTIEAAYAAAGLEVPQLNNPGFNPTDPAETIRGTPEVDTAILNIIAASQQLTAEVTAPPVAALNASQAFYISASLNVLLELNVVEILREAGPQGLHAKDIAAPSGVNPDLVSRLLRLLATHHVFRELTPDVYTNNRVSAVLDKGKSVKELFAAPEARLDGTTGLTALAEFFSSDVLRCSAELTPTILKPEPGVLPYNRAFGTDLPMYFYLQKPENLYRLKRFGLGMMSTERAEGSVGGFDFGSLKPGSVVVDVGSGNGHISSPIAQKYPQLKIVNQDLDQQIEQAKKHWATAVPSHVEKGLVEFQGASLACPPPLPPNPRPVHDFFNPQPVKNASVFMLRWIAHNWPDDRLVVILKNLRDAATPDTKLVIIEKIVLTAATEGSASEGVAGADKPVAPRPLLPNWGIGKSEFYYVDIGVHIMLGGSERTLVAFTEIFKRGGWKLDSVHHIAGSHQSHLVAVPL
ncbi:Methyltransf-2 domain-containing protein [Mycena kentingensis (nom. inval.)]|nr:Methyltransf-2 domain-containing protein [Mycena kentingensis (nom. inval.)]